MNISYTSQAIRDLKKLPLDKSRHIVAEIKKLPYTHETKDIKKLRTIDAFRLRVGRYRVIFTKDMECFKIRFVRLRNEKTYSRLSL